MLHFHVITVHPGLVSAYGAFGAFKAAASKGLAAVNAVNLRDYAVDRHGSIDDHPYGGGDGMVMRPEPLAAAVRAIAALGGEPPLVVMTSPGGKPWTQRVAERFATQTRPVVIVAGRFAGVDQRFLDEFVAEEYSVGDVILTGGELPALMMIDSVVRLIPGVLGHPDSARLDSFSADFAFGLEYPLYTRPPDFEGHKVPSLLLGGDHLKIAEWRRQAAAERTARLRPDLTEGAKPVAPAADVFSQGKVR